jgi:hypothetical protein
VLEARRLDGLLEVIHNTGCQLSEMTKVAHVL